MKKKYIYLFIYFLSNPFSSTAFKLQRSVSMIKFATRSCFLLIATINALLFIFATLTSTLALRSNSAMTSLPLLAAKISAVELKKWLSERTQGETAQKKLYHPFDIRPLCAAFKSALHAMSRRTASTFSTATANVIAVNLLFVFFFSFVVHKFNIF